MSISNDTRAAIVDLVTEFGWRADNGLGESISELFVEDCTVQAPHFSLAGRDEVHSWFSQRAAGGTRLSRHISTNFRIEAIAPDRYKVTSYALNLVGAPPAPSAIALLASGTAEDEIILVDGKALFATRRLTIAFEGTVQPREQAS